MRYSESRVRPSVVPLLHTLWVVPSLPQFGLWKDSHIVKRFVTGTTKPHKKEIMYTVTELNHQDSIIAEHVRAV